MPEKKRIGGLIAKALLNTVIFFIHGRQTFNTASFKIFQFQHNPMAAFIFAVSLAFLPMTRITVNVTLSPTHFSKEKKKAAM